MAPIDPAVVAPSPAPRIFDPLHLDTYSDVVYDYDDDAVLRRTYDYDDVRYMTQQSSDSTRQDDWVNRIFGTWDDMFTSALAQRLEQRLEQSDDGVDADKQPQKSSPPMQAHQSDWVDKVFGMWEGMRNAVDYNTFYDVTTALAQRFEQLEDSVDAQLQQQQETIMTALPNVNAPLQDLWRMQDHAQQRSERLFESLQETFYETSKALAYRVDRLSDLVLDLRDGQHASDGDGGVSTALAGLIYRIERLSDRLDEPTRAPQFWRFDVHTTDAMWCCMWVWIMGMTLLLFVVARAKPARKSA